MRRRAPHVYSRLRDALTFFPNLIIHVNLPLLSVTHTSKRKAAKRRASNYLFRIVLFSETDFKIRYSPRNFSDADPKERSDCSRRIPTHEWPEPSRQSSVLFCRRKALNAGLTPPREKKQATVNLCASQIP